MTTSATTTPRRARALAALEWLRSYRGEWLRLDLVAGLTLAAYLLPAGIGDASLAGLAPEAGLYACLFSGLVFWLFCSSKQTVMVAAVALLGVLGSGPVNGVLLGAAISIVLLIRQGARPRVVELARIPGTSHFADRARHPETEAMTDALVVRCESALLYFNVEYVRERLFELLSARADAVRLVVFFLGTVPRIDLAGAELIADLHKTLGARGVAFRLADPNGEVRESLGRIGFEAAYGRLDTGQTIDAVLSQWKGTAVSTSAG